MPYAEHQRGYDSIGTKFVKRFTPLDGVELQVVGCNNGDVPGYKPRILCFIAHTNI